MMEQKNVQYMSPEQVRNLDPSLIDYVHLSSGSIVKVGKVGNKQSSCEFQEEKVCPKVVICRHCGKFKIPSKTYQHNNVVLRAGKKDGEEAEKEVENVETQNEEGVVEGQAEGEQKEVLRGPDGKPLNW